MNQTKNRWIYKDAGERVPSEKSIFLEIHSTSISFNPKYVKTVKKNPQKLLKAILRIRCMMNCNKIYKATSTNIYLCIHHRLCFYTITLLIAVVVTEEIQMPCTEVTNSICQFKDIIISLILYNPIANRIG
jgi:hypothetical protein